MGGCQSKQSTNVANSTSKPEHAPSAAKGTRESESGERKSSHSSSHKEGGWFRSNVSGIHPEAVYVFKTTFFQPDGKQEKVFVNVFYHKKVESEHCLVQDKSVIVDKKGENCFAYGVVIASDLREKCLEEKYREWVSERVIELLNQLFPDARLDVKGVKLPIVKKGFMGDSIPYFSLDTNLVSWKSLSYTKSTDEPSTSTSNATPATTPNPVASNTATNTTESAATTTAASSSMAAGAKETSHSSSAATSATAASTTTASATTVASRAGTPPVSQADQSSTKPEKDAATEMAEIPVPRRLTGWMKKQGHVAKNWKTRFFVLDHGFLTYYVDQQEKPPFGVDKKGQVCLAGYRDKNAMKNAAGNAAILTAGYENKAGTSLQRPRDEDDDNEYDENDENSCLIQLEFFPQIVDAHALDELKRRNGDATFKHDVHKEFLLICRTQQERDGWLAALEAHTTYIEMIALKFIQQESSATAGSASTGTNTAATTDSSAKDTRSVSTANGDVKRPSLFTSNSLNNNSISRASRRASMALSAQKWSVFLNKNEKVVLMGIVEKPNPVGYRYLREMLLVQRQDADETATAAPAGESSKTGGCPKRLIYIDSNSYEKKGEMLWLDGANAKYPKVKVAGDRVEVTDVNGKQLIFYPKDDLTPEVWAQEINGIPPV